MGITCAYQTAQEVIGTKSRKQTAHDVRAAGLKGIVGFVSVDIECWVVSLCLCLLLDALVDWRWPVKLTRLVVHQ